MSAQVLVTGGTRGIGLATVERFLKAGARVMAWALNPQSVAAAREQLARECQSGQFLTVSVDIAQRDAVAAAMADTLEALPDLDTLINNAGWTRTTPFLEETAAYWEKVVATNLWGPIYTTHAFLRHIIARGQGGAIVNVVSDAARVGMAGEAVYAASKGGVISLTKSLAQEMARHHVRMNCVAPGPTRTRILEDNSLDAEALIARMIKRIPQRRIAEPAEVAEVIYFLASDAASHITGQVLSISGGLTMV